MKKKFLYIGLALLIVAIAVFVVAPGSVIPGAFPAPIPRSLSVGSGSLDSIAMTLNQSGIVIVTFNSSANVDLYVANATAFGAIRGAQMSNYSARSAALALEGGGVYEVYEDSGSGAFPYTGYPNVTAPAYLLNISLMPPGTYYAMFYNPGAASANLSVSYLPVSLAQIQSGGSSVLAYLAVSFIIFVAGLGFVIYSFLAKEKATEVATIDADAAKEYDRLEKKGRKKRG
ncbi:MAG: hypothetical protein KGI04_01215 [Candidatus Micrarchaeota archaeon]|nr:hypothetical protein [Candidatus Micrarchaeota archaeon]